MLDLRILTTGALFSAALLMAIDGAAAQTAADAKPGQPIQLLQKVFMRPAKEASETHLKTHPKTHHAMLTRHAGKAHAALARRKPIRQIAAAPAAPTANNTANNTSDTPVWPAVPPTPPTDAAASTPQPAPALVAVAPSELVVAGQTVRVASPNDVNEIDLAANDADGRTNGATPPTATTTEMSDIAQPKSDAITALTVQPRGSEVGSTSWILQVMAALGGAAAAGSVAWFLIGSTPQRMYG
jgi:hypothetical protein